jgi:hypothetical protein
MITNKNLLVRNLRGNWSLRLLFEYFYRNRASATSGYLEISKKEYFPPYKRAPIILNSVIRENLISKFFFHNPTSRVIKDNILVEARKHKVVRLEYTDYKTLFNLLRCKNSNDLTNFDINGIPYGKFIHTTLIAKYGVKHFKISLNDSARNTILFYRFLLGFRTIHNLIRDFEYSQIILINGRDAVGTGAQLAAYLSNINIVCLENNVNTSDHPKYSEWNGNMHHWKIREAAFKDSLLKSNGKFSSEDAENFLATRFGTHSKFWANTEPDETRLKSLNSKRFVAFFTTSEKETTTCPTGIKNFNEFDKFDQTESLINVYEAARELDLDLIVRLHPNFSNSKIARNELAYFLSLTNKWNNTTVISNSDPTNSYKLASLAIVNFSFRSSISAELSLLGINCFQTAYNGWSFTSPEKVKIKRKEILHAMQNYKTYTTTQSDSYALACYQCTFSSEFLSLKGVNQNLTNYSNYIDGKELDIPKYNFYKIRD